MPDRRPNTSSTLKAAKISEEQLIIHHCIPRENVSANNTVGQFGWTDLKHLVLQWPEKVHKAHNLLSVCFETVKVIYSGAITTHTSNTLQSTNTFMWYKLNNSFVTSHRNKGKDQLKKQGLTNSPLTISMHKNAPMPLLSACYFRNS